MLFSCACHVLATLATSLTVTFFYFVDCRICVWNAVDGSLVHSLTGHTASVSFIQFAHNLLCDVCKPNIIIFSDYIYFAN